MHYYSHHIGDFQRDTASLSDSDTMAYLRLIWMYYDTELPLPADAKKLAFKIGSNSDSVQMILDTFFIKEKDVYRHKRCDAVLNGIYDKSEKARNAAKARWEKSADAKHTLSDSNADASNNNADATKKDATQYPIPNTHINKAPKVATPDGVSDSLWEDFLAIRKVKKLPMTPTAMEGLKREAASASKTLSEALTICCERGWGGFNAKWLEKDLPAGGSKQLTMQEEMALRAKAKR
jgi:uncharacterized protein YdaU (DUF1376 family)